MRNQFFDPLTAETYIWQRNHAEEEDGTLTRAIQHTANTGQTGMVRQQGEDSPLKRTLRGKIFHRAQHQAMLKWWTRCRTQSIIFTDFEGNQAEVQITGYTFKRVRRLTAVAPDPTMSEYAIEYGLELEVWRFIDGDEAEAGVA